jgi:hypothetical protein
LNILVKINKATSDSLSEIALFIGKRKILPTYEYFQHHEKISLRTVNKGDFLVDQKKQELWKKRIEDYQSSGLSGVRWCAEQGISEHQFWYWKKKWKKSPTHTKEEVAPTWVPVMVEDPTPPKPTLTVRVGTVEIEVKPDYDATLLQDVVRTLMSLC